MFQKWLGCRWRLKLFANSSYLSRMLLKDGSTSRSLSPNESFLLRAEILPGGANGEQYPGYTFYRRVLPANGIIASPETADAGPGHWSPCYHFTLSTLSPLDIIMSNFYNEKAPEAPFVNFFVVSKLLTSGARKSLIFGLFGGNATKGLGDTPTAKLYTKEGLMGEEKDVRWIPFETAPIREILKKEFGYSFAAIE